MKFVIVKIEDMVEKGKNSISSFPTTFSTLSEYFPSFLSNLKLSSGISLNVAI